MKKLKKEKEKKKKEKKKKKKKKKMKPCLGWLEDCDCSFPRPSFGNPGDCTR